MASSPSSSSSSSAAAAAHQGPTIDPNDIRVILAAKIQSFASDKVNAALFSLKPGNDYFGLEALFTGSRTKKEENGVLTTIFGEPYTQQLDWGIVQGRGWHFGDEYELKRALSIALVNSGAFFLVLWKGERLPPLRTPVTFTADVASTEGLTGGRLRALVQSTFAVPPFSFISPCGCVGEPLIPGLNGYADLSDLVHYAVAFDVKRFIGPFKTK